MHLISNKVYLYMKDNQLAHKVKFLSYTGFQLVKMMEKTFEKYREKRHVTEKN